MGVRVYRSKAWPTVRGTADLPFLTDVRRCSVARRHCIGRSPQVAEPRRNVGQLRNRCVHARSISWRRIHFDRKWSSRCAIGAYSWAALAHLDDSQSPAHKMTNKPGAATIVKCSIGVAAESEDKISRTCSEPDRAIRGLFRGHLQQGPQALGGMLASRVQASRSSGQLKP
jgi:hypothetical protein